MSLESSQEILDELRSINRNLNRLLNVPSTPRELRKISVEESAEYVRKNFPGMPIFSSREQSLEFGLGQLVVDGAILEFGVHKGKTIGIISKARSEQTVFGFDSFQGLPQNWNGTGKTIGSFDLYGEMPKVDSNVELVPGWFDVTIPNWKEKHLDPIAFCHIDSDLYSSANTIFRALEDRFVDGTIIVFDEYFGYFGWKNGEHLAFMEFLDRTGFNYAALALSHMSLVVRLVKQTQPVTISLT